MKKKILMGWSGGKDSSLALRELLNGGEYDIEALLTTVTEGYDRISMHGVRRELLERQAEALGLNLHTVFIPQQSTNDIYEQRMGAALKRYLGRIDTCAFGDLFLEEIRDYRIKQLARVDMQAVFPIWGRDTAKLAREFVDMGFKAVIVCVNSKQLDPGFSGRFYDHAFLDDLPDGVDPCGENGEFHSFVFDGPIFKQAVACEVGETVMRDGFNFCEVYPT